MPFAEVAGGVIHYRIDGDPAAPTLLLSNSLGTDVSMWDRQVAAMSKTFRIIRSDTRGHGKSLVTPGPYSIERLGRDVVALLDHLKIGKTHFCGLSLGGMVGMWLAANEPSRVGRLVLANTAALMGPREGWDARIAAVRQGGMNAIANTVIERWFTPAFREQHQGAVQQVLQQMLATSAEGYTACCAAVRDMNQMESLSKIRSQTLVIAGLQDPATPPAVCRTVAEGISGARLVELSAAHLSNIEAADAFNAAVLEFLSD